jgi:uncharacterized protein YdhG (YjbR/CyaY superfamily)
MKNEIKTVDDYILNFSVGTQEKLRVIRQAILDSAPDAIESISYGMPAYKLNNKPLVYFAGFTNHIGFYATPTGHKKFLNRLSTYKHGKGSVQFPLNQPLPVKLISEIVEYRAFENSQESL